LLRSHYLNPQPYHELLAKMMQRLMQGLCDGIMASDALHSPNS
jgi:hypothetical protein